MSSSTEQTQPLVGSVLEGKYRLQRELGAGGMGVVYLAQHETIERKVAIKVLHQKLASDDSVRRRFETEAKAIARLSHPHCVMLYEFGFSEEIEALFAVFEYVEGKSLESWVGQSLPLEDVVEFGVQVAEGIAHAHDNNIIHRDLKPENIMIVPDKKGESFEAKLLDFGIARIAEDDEKRTRLTQMGQMFGTPPYMSPEQVRAKLNVTYATDIYSIGVILYEMIEGELPFLGETPIETVMMHLNEEVPPMSRKGIPDPLRAVVMRCLEKEAEDRFQSAEELAEALKEVSLSESKPSVLAASDISKVSGLSSEKIENTDEMSSTEASCGQSGESDEDIASGPTLLADEEMGALASEEEKKASSENEGGELDEKEESTQQPEPLTAQDATTQDLDEEGVNGEALGAGKSIWVVAALLVVVLGFGGVLGAAIFLGTDEEVSDQGDDEVTSPKGEVAEAEGLDESQDIGSEEDEPEEELAAVDGESDEDGEELSEESGSEEDGDSEETEFAEEDGPSEIEPAPAQPSPTPRREGAAPTQPEETASPQDPPQDEAQEPKPTAPDAITLPGGGDDEDEDEDDEAPQAPEGIGLPAPD